MLKKYFNEVVKIFENAYRHDDYYIDFVIVREDSSPLGTTGVTGYNFISRLITVVLFPDDDYSSLLPPKLKQLYHREVVIHEVSHAFNTDLLRLLEFDRKSLFRFNVLEDLRVDVLAEMLFPGHIKRMLMSQYYILHKYVFKANLDSYTLSSLYTMTYMYTGRTHNGIPIPEIKRKLDLCRKLILQNPFDAELPFMLINELDFRLVQNGE